MSRAVLAGICLVVVAGLSGCSDVPAPPDLAIESPTSIPTHEARSDIPSGPGSVEGADTSTEDAIQDAVVCKILVKDLDVVGEWDGDAGAAVRAFADVHLIQDKDFESRGMFQVDFIVETGARMTAQVRFADFKDGILKLDEPIEDEAGINSALPFSELLAVRTD
jgi:hypothetical protein